MTVNGVQNTALFGDTIHVIVDNKEQTIDYIANFFKNNNMATYKLEEIEASLEDVFVTLIEDYEKPKGDL